MNTKQMIAIAAPVVLVIVMIPVFRAFANRFGDWPGWFLGLSLYWMVWGGLFSLWMIGVEGIRAVIQPSTFTPRILIAFLIPIIFSGISRLTSGSNYDKSTIWNLLMVVTTTLGNGFFEELLWRGVYLRLFPDSILWQVIWPSIWFGLWHFAPASVHSEGIPFGMMIGSTFFGFVLSFTAKWSGTAFWGVLMHTISGLILVF